VVRIEGLDDHPPGMLAPPSPSGNLGQKLEGPLRGAKIREIQGDVRQDDAYEGDLGKVMPFGDHLRAHDDVDFLPAEGVEQLFVRPPAVHGVAVHAADPGGGEPLPYFLLQTFRAHAIGTDTGAPTVEASRLTGEGVVAVMTFPDVFSGMVDQGDLAVPAAERPAAIAAEEEGVIAPPVQEE